MKTGGNFQRVIELNRPGKPHLSRSEGVKSAVIDDSVLIQRKCVHDV